MKKEVPDGLFFAAVTKFAASCGNNSYCSFGKILMGKDSWLKFHGGVNKAGVNVRAGVYGIPIKGDLKFNKVELFIEVRTSRFCFFVKCCKDMTGQFQPLFPQCSGQKHCARVFPAKIAAYERVNFLI